MGKAIRIVRKHPRDGETEEAVKNKDGFYVLGDPAHGNKKHHASNAVYVKTLDEAADLVENRGFSIRMASKGKPPSLISPANVHIVRDP